ncbi:MAG TPA: NAD(P)-dependent alcohol dehydrogenase [Actinobacteria bacterium]|nr:alcohol dehydrogenase [bacterium BMS3Bbin01]HDH26062.1 NAD(P)-dependent alcohol dehydrogenase [Actinomycetota bacterium]
MRALQLNAPQQPPELREVPVPEPGPGEVVIKIAGSGACHSDLHIMEWPAEMLPFELPFTLGHENSGWIHELGAGVSGFEKGEPVLVYGPWGCGRCKRCRMGMENYCEQGMGASGGGLGLDGGMAEYMLVPSARHLLPLGDLDPVDAAPLTDAGLTPYHAVKRSVGKLGAGSHVVVIGAGGLGQMGIQFLRALTPATVIAVEADEAKLPRALEVGAHHAILATDETVKEIFARTNDRGSDVVIDFVGMDSTMLLGSQIARPLGDLTVVGLAMGTLPFNFFAIGYEASLQTTYWGSATELMEVLDLARQGMVKSLIRRFPLDGAVEAYQLLREGKIEGRAVIVPHADAGL